eukprot:3729792-Rhodomonas_salina.1
MVACSAPASGAGTVAVTVSFNGQRTDAGQPMMFAYLATSAVLIQPTRGGQKGGTMVTVSGPGVSRDVEDIGCAFGKERVRAQYHEPHGWVCASPSRAGPGVVDFSVLRGAVPISLGEERFF